MNELDIIRRAETYLRKLSQGIDPITDTEVPSDSVLDQVRLTRCFAFTADVLRRVIEQGGVEGHTPRSRTPHRSFVVPEGVDLTVLADEQPVQITRLVQAVRDRCDPEGTGPRLGAVTVTNWLVSQGYLEDQTDASGKRRRAPTARGAEIGITAQPAEGVNGPYLQVRYGPAAQRLILSELPRILRQRQEN